MSDIDKTNEPPAFDLGAWLRDHPDKMNPAELAEFTKYPTPKYVNRIPDAHMGPDVTHRCPICGAPYAEKYGLPKTCSGEVQYVQSEYSDGRAITFEEDSTHYPVSLRPLDRSITEPLPEV